MDSYLLEELSWYDVEAYLNKEDIIILPIASIEQHGPHLPLGTDSIDAEYIAKIAGEKSEVLVAPIVKFGISGNHIDFPGTITVSTETLINLISDICRSLSFHGFKKILILNGHGGNNATIDVAIVNLKTELPDTIVGQSYVGALFKASSDVLEDEIKYHADEGETSCIMFTAPHLVKRDRIKQQTPHSKSGLFVFQGDELFSQNTFYNLPKTKAATPSGIFGNPPLATKEKGKYIIDKSVEVLVGEVEKLKGIDVKEFEEGWTKI